MTESIQNIGHHSRKNNESVSNTDLIMVVSKKNFYKIITGNLIESNEVDALSKQLEEINKMNKEELRDYYKKVMSTEGFSDKGTAGLGFIDMARKTGQKLKYRFTQMDDTYSYFTFEVKISR